MLLRLVIPYIAVFTVSGCAISNNSSVDSTTVEWRQAPLWVKQRIQNQWWKQYRDPELNRDISTAFRNNPDLATIAARFERANAIAVQAKAAGKPHVNLGLGYREGRKKNIDFGPYDLAPYESNAQLSWEIDLSGKLEAATKAAEAHRNSAFWEIHAAKLQLATKIAATRFQIYKLNAEINILARSTAASADIIKQIKSRTNVGISSVTELHRQEADHLEFTRQKIEVERLRSLAFTQLQYLVGGSIPHKTMRSTLPEIQSPKKSSLQNLLSANPSLLAANAKLRSAFQLEKSARLNLLPSLTFQAGTQGTQPNLSDRYKVWLASIGPKLDIPVYDPTRLAQLKTRRTEAKIASSQYRQSILKIIEEVESSDTNYSNRQHQLNVITSEIEARQEVKSNTREQYNNGLISQIDYLDTERRLLESQRSELTLRYLLLLDQLLLTKALGGS